jgi:hypothetical protein
MDGNLARGACEEWARLRVEYISRVVADSPYQLNQWFSGPDWAKSYSDVNKLGSDPSYSHLETAYGAATLGDTASVAWAGLLDRACSAGD